jgi:hypothetical protein
LYTYCEKLSHTFTMKGIAVLRPSPENDLRRNPLFAGYRSTP